MEFVVGSQFLTEERRAEEAKRQAEQKAKRGHLIPSHPAQHKYHFGLSQLNAATPLEANNPLRAQMLCDGFTNVGDFANAARHCTNPTIKAELEAKAKAMSSLGQKLCPCPETRMKASPNDAKGIAVNVAHVIEEVWNGQTVVKLVKCLDCGTISTRY